MGLRKRLSNIGDKVSSYLLPVFLILCMFAVVIFIGIHQVSADEKHIHEESLSDLTLNSQIITQQIDDMYLSL